jgi:hypothetical protein
MALCCCEIQEQQVATVATFSFEATAQWAMHCCGVQEQVAIVSTAFLRTDEVQEQVATVSTC